MEGSGFDSWWGSLDFAIELILLQAGRLRGRSSRLGRVKNFLHVVQIGSEADSASYPMRTGSLSPWVKRQGREADHLPPTSAEVKKMWIYTSAPSYVFMVVLN
jgi:hypothetical protein